MGVGGGDSMGDSFGELDGVVAHEDDDELVLFGTICGDKMDDGGGLIGQ